MVHVTIAKRASCERHQSAGSSADDDCPQCLIEALGRKQLECAELERRLEVYERPLEPARHEGRRRHELAEATHEDWPSGEPYIPAMSGIDAQYVKAHPPDLVVLLWRVYEQARNAETTYGFYECGACGCGSSGPHDRGCAIGDLDDWLAAKLKRTEGGS